MKVLLGITGGVAAYKAAELIRALTEAGHEVRVVPTENALRFIGKTTLEALSHNVVDADLYTDVESVKHIELGQWADVVLVAPATASFLARTAAGIADDLLGNVVLATSAKLVFAPAMHTEMWLNEATKNNVQLLEARGIRVIEPASGRLTGADSGIGRLPDTETIVAATLDGSLRGKNIVVTAGGTREPIDPVRFLGNSSSGRQGIAVALAARDAGANVTLVAANIEALPSGIDVVRVQTALELKAATEAAVRTADALVMTAAVADFRPKYASEKKLKRSELGDELSIELVANPDILAGISKPGLLKVGFAAETSADLAPLALSKLAAKGCQILVANDVTDGQVFGSNENSVLIVTDSGSLVEVAGTKRDVADALIDIIASRLG
jgi:phosphopantothenoylcysteine decarboxylase / phosphopantothenate---cysteine ligase